MEKEITCSRDLLTKTLHAVVDHLIDGPEDVCQVCAFYCKELQLDTADDTHPCVWYRKNGKLACRNGIIEKFQLDLLSGGTNDERKEN